MSESSMAHMAHQIANIGKDKGNRPVAREKYDQWLYHYSFDALQGLTLGRSFCKKFKIHDYILTHSSWLPRSWVRNYIKKNYVVSVRLT